MNSEEREAVLRARLGSLAIPHAFAITLAWDKSFWANQENGVRRDGPVWRPSKDDVEAMLWEGTER